MAPIARPMATNVVTRRVFVFSYRDQTLVVFSHSPSRALLASPPHNNQHCDTTRKVNANHHDSKKSKQNVK